jgi:hypothetical protein
MKEHGYGPLVWPNCACDHCVTKRKILFRGAEMRENGEDIDINTKAIAEKIFFNPSSGPVERKLAEKILYFVPRKKRPCEQLPPGHRKTMVERKCEQCSKPMKVRLTDVNRNWGRYCSLDCRARSMTKPPKEARA